jgi:hypothetical protein
MGEVLHVATHYATALGYYNSRRNYQSRAQFDIHYSTSVA